MELRKFLLFVFSLAAMTGVTAQDGWRTLPKCDLFGEAREARVYDGKLYLATDKGIFACPLLEGQNTWECVGFNGMNIVGFAKCGDQLLAVRRTVIEKTIGPREWYHHLLSSNTGSTTSIDITPSDIIHESEYGIRIMQLYDGQPEHLYLTYCNTTSDKPCTMLETNDFAKNWSRTGARDWYAAYDGAYVVVPSNPQNILVYGYHPHADCCCPYLLETKDGFQTLEELYFEPFRNFYFGDIAVCPTDNSQLLAATSAGIAKSVDHGANWTICNGGGVKYYDYHSSALGYHFVSFDPLQPLVAYATSCKEVDKNYYIDVYRSEDGGDNWQIMSTSPALSAKMEAAILNGSQLILVSSVGEVLCFELGSLSTMVAETAGNGYHPMLTEGKVWNYTAHQPVGDVPFSIEVRGDSTIEKQVCKKLYLRTTQGTWLYGCYYEAFEKVVGWQLSDFSIDNGQWTVKDIQFPTSRTLYVFPKFTEWNWYWASSYESLLISQTNSRWFMPDVGKALSQTHYIQSPIMVRNSLFNRMELGNGEKSELWVSGVGSRHWGILEPDHEGRLDWLEFETCEEDGEVVFSKDDFDTTPMEMDYRPLIEEDKTWLCQGYKGGDVLTTDGYYLYSCYLKGDTVVGSRHCKKMYMYNDRNLGETTYEGAFYEESRRVYRFLPGQEDAQLMYDFSLDNGDETTVHCASTGSWHIRKVADVYQMYDGKPRHVTIFSEDEPTFKGYWMDGVGVLSRFCVMNPAGFSLLGGIWGAGVIECSINGDILYRSSDYETIMGIDSPNFTQKSTPFTSRNLYDLQGRRLNAKPTKGIYIQNGKKYLTK